MAEFTNEQCLKEILRELGCRRKVYGNDYRNPMSVKSRYYAIMNQIGDHYQALVDAEEELTPKTPDMFGED